jgi:hypothetical protein
MMDSGFEDEPQFTIIWSPDPEEKDQVKDGEKETETADRESDSEREER